jgi:hypothetical protein
MTHCSRHNLSQIFIVWAINRTSTLCQKRTFRNKRDCDKLCATLRLNDIGLDMIETDFKSGNRCK